jgi:SAM-dependent methyltransferase
MKKEEGAYILGTDWQELHRLGVQHQIWAMEAHNGWLNAGFTAGHTLLDLGCGPGFCTTEMAYIAGETGKVIGVDKSKAFTDHLDDLGKKQGLNIEAVCSDFDQMTLKPESLDGMFCRWALAWLPNPREVLKKVHAGLKKGGAMVIQEYYDWSTLQTQPRKEDLATAIAAALRSFKEQEGEIDIGRELPQVLDALGMKIESVRIMPKLALPGDFTWQWPKTFFYSYFPRLVETGYLSREVKERALEQMEELERTPGASLSTPMMVEVVARK